MLKTIVIGLIITIVGLFAFASVDNIIKQTQATPALVNGYETTSTPDENTVNVAISGEVNHPGSYYINPNKTLGELITLAGGVTTSADTSSYNPSLIINTRTSFYIPPVLIDSGVCVEKETEKVNINKASEAELISVGFTSSQAPSVITYRQENGLFEAIEDILNVKGVGKATFEKVKNRICIS